MIWKDISVVALGLLYVVALGLKVISPIERERATSRIAGALLTTGVVQLIVVHLITR